MTQLSFIFDPGDQAERIAQAERRVLKALKDWALAVSYTHLTLPTIYSV